MKSLREIESVGWIFWTVIFVLLLYPSYLLVKTVTYDSASDTLMRAGAGVFVAALSAGLISWAVNALLQKRVWRKMQNKRKVERRQRKRNKK